MDKTFEQSGIVSPTFNPTEKPDTKSRQAMANYLASRDFHFDSPYYPATYAANVKLWGFEWQEEDYEVAAWESLETGDWYNFNFLVLRRDWMDEHPGYTVSFAGRSGGWLHLNYGLKDHGYFESRSVEDLQNPRLAECLNREMDTYVNRLKQVRQQARNNALYKFFETSKRLGSLEYDLKRYENNFSIWSEGGAHIPIASLTAIGRYLLRLADEAELYAKREADKAEDRFKQENVRPVHRNQWLAYTRADLMEEFELVWDFYEFAALCCRDFAYSVWDQVHNG